MAAFNAHDRGTRLVACLSICCRGRQEPTMQRKGCFALVKESEKLLVASSTIFHNAPWQRRPWQTLQRGEAVQFVLQLFAPSGSNLFRDRPCRCTKQATQQVSMTFAKLASHQPDMAAAQSRGCQARARLNLTSISSLLQRPSVRPNAPWHC